MASKRIDMLLEQLRANFLFHARSNFQVVAGSELAGEGTEKTSSFATTRAAWILPFEKGDFTRLTALMTLDGRGR